MGLGALLVMWAVGGTAMAAPLPADRAMVPFAVSETGLRPAARIVLLGPPGAGKATQAARLAKSNGVPAISTGQLLRDAAAVVTMQGTEIKAILERGDVVPDDIVIALLKARLKQPDAADGWILHGFPRTLLQALALDHMLVQVKQAVSLVVSLQVPEKVMVERLVHRQVCRTCSRTYNTETNPPAKPGICDDDRGELIHRDEDDEKNATQRIEDQLRLNEEMKAYYGSRDMYLGVDGAQSIDSIQRAIESALQQRRG
ncbi:MAG: nucleoside monophosphate kinase [Candidatus Sericytochromatia bacterium]|nr:nucleoside monophosphate kinase [Candidatus Sericytochromatia bacterium]